MALFKRKCSCCGHKSVIVYDEWSHYYAGSYKVRYCIECLDKKRKQDGEQMERYRQRSEEIQKEKDRKAYHEWLKREVEIAQLEKKAEKFGIDLEDGKYE
jgi:glucose-6-phosphate isomerase